MPLAYCLYGQWVQGPFSKSDASLYLEKLLFDNT